MALAPLLYNITFDSQTRILYFWDKAGHEIYHCEIPSPAPALPTVSRIGNYMVTYTSMNLSPQQISPWLFTISSYINQSSYPNSTFAARRGWTGSGGSTVNGSNLSCVWDDTDGGAGIYQVTRLSVKNISSSNITLYTVDIYECSSLSATVITVYDSSNNPYNAFKYTSDGTDYYYVLDGTQTDWTDDLSGIGYSLQQIYKAYLNDNKTQKQMQIGMGSYLYDANGNFYAFTYDVTYAIISIDGLQTSDIEKLELYNTKVATPPRLGISLISSAPPGTTLDLTYIEFTMTPTT